MVEDSLYCITCFFQTKVPVKAFTRCTLKASVRRKPFKFKTHNWVYHTQYRHFLKSWKEVNYASSSSPLVYVNLVFSTTSTHEHLGLYFQLCIWDDYLIFPISLHVITRLLLDEIYNLWELPFDWLMMGS